MSDRSRANFQDMMARHNAIKDGKRHLQKPALYASDLHAVICRIAQAYAAYAEEDYESTKELCNGKYSKSFEEHKVGLEKNLVYKSLGILHGEADYLSHLDGVITAINNGETPEEKAQDVLLQAPESLARISAALEVLANCGHKDASGREELTVYLPPMNELMGEVAAAQRYVKGLSADMQFKSPVYSEIITTASSHTAGIASRRADRGPTSL